MVFSKLLGIGIAANGEGEVGTPPKCRDINAGNAIWDGDAGQRRTLRKYTISDACDAVRDGDAC